MRSLVLAAAFLSCVAAAPGAQIPDAAVVVSQLRNTATTFGGELWAFDASSTTPWTTVNAQLLTDFPNWVEMDAANSGFIVPYVNATALNGGHVLHVSAGGVNNTLASMPTDYLNNLDLDFDGVWLGVGSQALLSFNGNAVSTLYADPAITTTWNELAIDRDPTGPELVIARFATTGVRLFGATRAMTVQTINTTLNSLSGVEVIPETGQYLCCGFDIPGVHVVNKDGTIAQTVPVSGANGAHVNADGTAWVIGMADLNRVDYNTGTITSTTMPTNLPGMRVFAPSGVTVYGSRQVTCRGTGKPGSVVAIAVSSRNPADAGAGYQLACSFWRRPAIPIPGTNNRLFLTPDDLFRLSVSNALPNVFRNFIGQLDGSGNATLPVSVSIPANLPANLGLTVFVSGVSVGSTGIQSVFNTHWFELD